jgi:hypothetical protein
VEDLKQAPMSESDSQFETRAQDAQWKAYDASIPNFGRVLLSVRGGGRQLKGEAGMALLPSSPEVK